MQALMTRSPEELSQPWGKLMCLGLGLLFLGKQLATEATLEVSWPPASLSATGELGCWRHKAPARLQAWGGTQLEPVHWRARVQGCLPVPPEPTHWPCGRLPGTRVP